MSSPTSSTGSADAFYGAIRTPPPRPAGLVSSASAPESSQDVERAASAEAAAGTHAPSSSTLANSAPMLRRSHTARVGAPAPHHPEYSASAAPVVTAVSSAHEQDHDPAQALPAAPSTGTNPRREFPTVKSDASSSRPPSIFDSPSFRRRGFGAASSSAGRPQRSASTASSGPKPPGTLPLIARLNNSLVPTSADSSYHDLDESASASLAQSRSARGSAASWRTARSSFSGSTSSRFRTVLATTSRALNSSFQKVAELAEDVAQTRTAHYTDLAAHARLVGGDDGSATTGSDDSFKSNELADADADRSLPSSSLDGFDVDSLGERFETGPSSLAELGPPPPPPAAVGEPAITTRPDPEAGFTAPSAQPTAPAARPARRVDDDEPNAVVRTVLGSAAQIFTSKSTRLVSFLTLRFTSKSIEAKFREHYVRTSSAPILLLSVGLLPLIFARAGLSAYTASRYHQVTHDCPMSVHGECDTCQSIVTVAYVVVGVVALLTLGVSLLRALRIESPGSRRAIFIAISIVCFLIDLMAVTCPGYCHTNDGSPLFRRHNSFSGACPGSAAAGSIDALVHFWSTQISVSVYVVLAASTLAFRTAGRGAVLAVGLLLAFGALVDSSAASWVWLLAFNLADDAVKSLVGLYQRELLVRATFYHNVRQAAATHAQLRAAATSAVLPYVGGCGAGGGAAVAPSPAWSTPSPREQRSAAVTVRSSATALPNKSVLAQVPAQSTKTVAPAQPAAPQPQMRDSSTWSLVAQPVRRTPTTTSSNTAVMAYNRNETSLMMLRRHSFATSRTSAASASTTAAQGVPAAMAMAMALANPKTHMSRLPSEDETMAMSKGSQHQHLAVADPLTDASSGRNSNTTSDSGGGIHVSQLDLGNLLTLPRIMHASLLSLSHSDTFGGGGDDTKPVSPPTAPKFLAPLPLGAIESGTRYATTTLDRPDSKWPGSGGTATNTLLPSVIGSAAASPTLVRAHLDAPRLVVVATTLDHDAVVGASASGVSLPPPLRDTGALQSDLPVFHPTMASYATATTTTTTSGTDSSSGSTNSVSSNTTSPPSTDPSTDPSSAGSSLGVLGSSAPAIPRQSRSGTDSGALPPHRPLHDAWRRPVPRYGDRPDFASGGGGGAGAGNVRDSVVITSSMLPALEPMGLDAALRTDEEYSVSTSSMQGAASSTAEAAAARRRARRQSRGTTASAASRRSTWYRRLRRALHRLRTEFFYRFPDPAEEERYLAYYYAKLKTRMQITAVTGFLMQLLVAVMMKLSQAGRQAVNDAMDDTDGPVGNGMFGDWLARVKPFVLEWWFPYALHLAFYTIQLVVARSRSALFVGASLERYAVAHAVIFIACVVALDAQIRMLTHNFVLIQSACHQVLAAVFGIATLRLRPRTHAAVLAAFVLLVQAEFIVLLVHGAAIETLAKIVIVTATTLVSLVLSVYFESANRRYFQIKSHVARASQSRRDLPFPN
ncbi:hypothetical protein H9P43_005812 [Blastocladiella emersonii ATCC 22665]|nr:hypothetical protein H9P43_005812 [Blastocladiella emersonii ATCC 22665]